MNPLNRQDLIKYCLTFPSAYEDYPFDETVSENSTAVMRHRGNKKGFAFIMNHHGKLYLNLKCDPLEADFLRQAFRAVIPGWHMNHTHWNTVVCDKECDVVKGEIKKMIANSYELIKPRAKRG